MSQWIDRVRDHNIWSVLETVGPSLDSALERNPISVEAIDALERVRFVLTYCGKRLASIDPLLVVPSVLEALSAQMSAIKAQVEAFVGNGEIGHLNKANQHADNALANIVSVSNIVSPEELTILSEAAATYRATLQKHLKEALSFQKQISEKNTANETRVSSIESSLNEEQKRLTSLLTEQQSQFSAAQDKRASDFAASQSDFLAKFTNQITEQQTQFSNEQDARRNVYSQFERKSQDALSDLIKEYDEKLKTHDATFLEQEGKAQEAHRNKLEALDAEYQSQALDILTEIRKHKLEVESLVGVIGNLGVTSGYKKVADQARTMLYIWQFLTVFALGCLVVIAFKIAFPSTWNGNSNSEMQVQYVQPDPIKQDVSKELNKLSKGDLASEVKISPNVSSSDSHFYQGLITRIFLSLTFGIFAAYAGRQASHFFNIEQKNRKLALELEALGPFIEPLSKEDRDKFRVQIGERSFGVPDNDAPKRKEGDPVTMLDLLKSADIKEFISELKDAIKKP